MTQDFEEKELLELINKHSDGISIGKIFELTLYKWNKRALQRTLNVLITQSQIAREGKGRGTIYIPLDTCKIEWEIPLSKKGEKIFSGISAMR